jgi:hypothetical protein
MQPEHLDEEITEPPGTGPWSDDPAADWGDNEDWEPWTGGAA